MDMLLIFAGAGPKLKCVPSAVSSIVSCWSPPYRQLALNLAAGVSDPFEDHNHIAERGRQLTFLLLNNKVDPSVLTMPGGIL